MACRTMYALQGYYSLLGNHRNGTRCIFFRTPSFARSLPGMRDNFHDSSILVYLWRRMRAEYGEIACYKSTNLIRIMAMCQPDSSLCRTQPKCFMPCIAHDGSSSSPNAPHRACVLPPPCAGRWTRSRAFLMSPTLLILLRPPSPTSSPAQ